jgi:hypothetical protein
MKSGYDQSTSAAEYMIGQRAQLDGGSSVQDCYQITEGKWTRPDGEGGKEKERREGRKETQVVTKAAVIALRCD